MRWLMASLTCRMRPEDPRSVKESQGAWHVLRPWNAGELGDHHDRTEPTNPAITLFFQGKTFNFTQSTLVILVFQIKSVRLFHYLLNIAIRSEVIVIRYDLVF